MSTPDLIVIDDQYADLFGGFEPLDCWSCGKIDCDCDEQTEALMETERED